MAKVWKSAIIGCGTIGAWHGRVLRGLANAELVAVCNVRDEATRRRVQADLGDVATHETLEALLAAHPEIEICHIATPSGAHLEPAIACMRAGRHVICEKPLEITVDRCRAMIETAAACGVKLAGVLQNRWREENQALKRAVEAGRFGTIAYAGCFTPWWRSEDYYRSGAWRGTWALDGGGAVMNQSIHYVDLLQWLAGPVKQVTATASSRVHTQIEVEDTLCGAVEFESGARGAIMGSTAMYPGFSQRLEIGGDGGTVMTGDIRAARFRREGAAEYSDETGTFFPAEDATSGGGAAPTDMPLYPHERNIAHIYDAWQQGREPLTTATEAAGAVAIVEALYTSARDGGRPVEVVKL